MKIFFPLIIILIISAISPVINEAISPYIFTIFIYAGINIILSASLNLVNGITGQFSMGHAGFMAIGAYVSSYLTLNIFPLATLPVYLQHTLFGVALLIGGLVAALLGYVVGLPSLRLKGDYLAIVTLGFGEIIRVIILNVNAVGGSRGMPGIPKLTTFGWVYSIVFILLLFIRRLMHSPHGRALLSVREDEIAAEATGVNTTSYKIRAFIMGAFFAGIAGGLFGHSLTYLNPSTFDFNRSFEIISMVVLGGMGSTTGAVFAAILLTALRELLRPLQEILHFDIRMVLYSLLLVVLMLTRPKGLFGFYELSDFKFFRRFKRI